MTSLAEAYVHAHQHEQYATLLRREANALAARADVHERLARHWREWADDSTGLVPDPKEEMAA